MKFRPTTKPRDGTPTPPEDEPGMPESDYDNDPPVSGPIVPITMPLELLVLGREGKVALTALLDSGCTQCLVTQPS